MKFGNQARSSSHSTHSHIVPHFQQPRSSSPHANVATFFAVHDTLFSSLSSSQLLVTGDRTGRNQRDCSLQLLQSPVGLLCNRRKQNRRLDYPRRLRSELQRHISQSVTVMDRFECFLRYVFCKGCFTKQINIYETNKYAINNLTI